MPVFYPNHKKEKYECKKCGWKGLGEEAHMGSEYAGVGFQLDCPICRNDEEIGFVEFPFLEDVAKNGSGLDQLLAQQQLDHLNAMGNYTLNSLSLLPEIDCWQLTFVIQEKEIRGTKYLIVTSEGAEIWRELSYWEYYQRFIEIGNMLLQKYGRRVMDIIPDVPWINIYGDSMSGADKIHSYRMKIREKYMIYRSVFYKDNFSDALKEIAAQERRKNPKTFLDKWLNKLEKWSTQ